MAQGDSEDNPLSVVSTERALDQWYGGGGSPLHVDMSDHLSFGGGSVFGVGSFAESISYLNSGHTVGSEYHLESIKERALSSGDPRIVANHNYYTNDGVPRSLEEAHEMPNSFVWGKTAATINSTVTVLYETTINTTARPFFSESVMVSAFSLNGEIRSQQEQFDFESHFWWELVNLRNPLPELVKILGASIIEDGTPFPIKFVGDGKVIDGTYVAITTYSSTADPTGQGWGAQSTNVRIITIDPNLSEEAKKAQVAVHVFGNDGDPNTYPDAIVRRAAGYEGGGSESGSSKSGGALPPGNWTV